MCAAAGVAEGVGVGGRVGSVLLEAVDGHQPPAAQECAGSEQLCNRPRDGVEQVSQHRIAQTLPGPRDRAAAGDLPAGISTARPGQTVGQLRDDLLVIHLHRPTGTFQQVTALTKPGET